LTGCATPLPTSGSPEDWNSVEQYSALYSSALGYDVEAGKTYSSRIRLQIIAKPENAAQTHADLYQRFLSESQN